MGSIKLGAVHATPVVVVVNVVRDVVVVEVVVVVRVGTVCVVVIVIVSPSDVVLVVLVRLDVVVDVSVVSVAVCEVSVTVTELLVEVSVIVVVDGKHSMHSLQTAHVQTVDQGLSAVQAFQQPLRQVACSSRCVVVVERLRRPSAVVVPARLVLVVSVTVVSSVVVASAVVCVTGGMVVGGSPVGITTLWQSKQVAHVGQLHLMNHGWLFAAQ
mmetsp:Transcript_44280/g.102259  ORF Transcript_44280/g.102259 Transcript_44280/m.102259 type:complete len:213 (+) Transcript_44280:691-1329(+)